MNLAEFKKLTENATKGPWYSNDSGISCSPEGFPGYPPSCDSVASLYDGEYIENPNAKIDAAFIAAARDMVPKLIEIAELAHGALIFSETAWGPNELDLLWDRLKDLGLKTVKELTG